MQFSANVTMARRHDASTISIPTITTLDNAAAAMDAEVLCLPAEFFRPSFCQTPERKFYQAVIEDALHALSAPAGTEVYCEACLWFRGDEADVTFVDCCEALQVSASSIQRGLAPILNRRCRQANCRFLAPDHTNGVTA